MKPIVRPVLVDDEPASVCRPTWNDEPTLRPGARLDVEVDGRRVACEIVGSAHSEIRVRRVHDEASG